jgi:hypothetical protein
MTREELEAAHCWDPEDTVPGRPQMTAFRRALRLHNARWREAHGHPIGTQPIAPKPGARSRPVGSRLPLDYARETAATFVTPGARAAARARAAATERHQSFDHQRFWADLLWSPALAVNLFTDEPVARSIAPEGGEVRFAYSPGRLDPQYLNSLRAFDAAFLADDSVVAVDVKYHDRAKPEIPRPENLARYRAVADRSGIFARGAVRRLSERSELAVMWLEHLLLHSMLQHPDGRWRRGRYVVVHPAGNSDIARVCREYCELLEDDSTFASVTLDDLPLLRPVRERYLAP